MAGKKKIGVDVGPENAELRSRAERLLRELHGKEPLAAGVDLAHALHELQVHHIELEMQNEELRRAQTELEVSHRKYADLFDVAPVGYFVLDAKGVIVEANLAGAAMLGIERKWLTGKLFSVFVAKESRNAMYSHRRKAMGESGADSCELSLARKDGLRLYAAVATHGEGHGKEARYMMTVADITPRKMAEMERDRLNDELMERNNELAILSAQLKRTEEKERQRMSHVLHDELQQLLAAARLRVMSLRREGNEKVSRAATEVDELIHESIKASRALAGELSPPILHGKGLVAALEWLQRWKKEKYGLTIELSTGEGLEEMGEEVAMIMFHSIRELLSNIVKHSGVKQARVEVDRQGERVRAVISDEGAGFDPSVLGKHNGDKGGFGLFAIRERLAVMGGSLRVESAPGKGSRITLLSPPVKVPEPNVKLKMA